MFQTVSLREQYLRCHGSALQCSAVQCSAVNEGSKLSEIIQEETDGVYRQIGKQKENEWKCF